MGNKLKGVNQKFEPSKIEMDARKFLRTINEGAQAKIAFFDKAIKEMGERIGSNFSLTALNGNSVIFEDTDTNIYHVADMKKLKGGNYQLDNIRTIDIVESQKSDAFNKLCNSLIECIAEEDDKGAERAFAKIEASRFRSRVIPENGYINTKDNKVHKVNVSDRVIPEGQTKELVKAVVEAFENKITISKDRVVKAVFSEDDDSKILIPINEYIRRRCVARNMKNIAENAWQSEGFCARIYDVAKKIVGNKIEEAIRSVKDFTRENQEFCVLTESECNELVSNALAAKNKFNPILVEHTSKLFYKTALMFNHQDIIESWKKTAEKSENVDFVNNTKVLEESASYNEFEQDYQVFLDKLFTEDLSSKEVRMQAYLNSLRLIRKSLKDMGEMADEALVDNINNLINRMQQQESIDDALMGEVESLLSGISEEMIDRVDTLEDFDAMPGIDTGEEGEEVAPIGDEEEVGGAGGAFGGGAEPIIQLPGEGGEEELEAEPGEGEEEFEAGAEEGEGEEEEEELPALESKDKSDFTPIKEMNVEMLREEATDLENNLTKYLVEDGYQDIMTQLTAYCDRCQELGLSGEDCVDLLEKYTEFKEKIDNLVAGTTPTQEPEDDAYAIESPEAEEEAEDTGAFSSYGGEEEEESEEEEEESEGEEEETNEEVGDETEGDEEEEESEEEMDEDQYKSPSVKKLGYKRSSVTAESKDGAFAVYDDNGEFVLRENKTGEEFSLGEGDFDFDIKDDNSFKANAKEWIETFIDDTDHLSGLINEARGKNRPKPPTSAQKRKHKSDIDVIAESMKADEDLLSEEVPDFIKKKMEEREASKKGEGDEEEEEEVNEGYEDEDSDSTNKVDADSEMDSEEELEEAEKKDHEDYMMFEDEGLQEKKMTYKQRKQLPDKSFALEKERKYPIQDEAHARNALARVSAHGTPAEKKEVKREVKAKYPDIEVSEDIEESYTFGQAMRCPDCGSNKIRLFESDQDNAECDNCGVNGKRRVFSEAWLLYEDNDMTDPDNAKYKGDKPAKTPNPGIKQGKESGVQDFKAKKGANASPDDARYEDDAKKAVRDIENEGVQKGGIKGETKG